MSPGPVVPGFILSFLTWGARQLSLEVTFFSTASGPFVGTSLPGELIRSSFILFTILGTILFRCLLYWGVIISFSGMSTCFIHSLIFVTAR
jgi:hypothetical protein